MCQSCGSNRVDIERINAELPDGIETVTLRYLSGGYIKTFRNPNTGLMRQAGGAMKTIQVPKEEVDWWINFRRRKNLMFGLFAEDQESLVPENNETTDPIVEPESSVDRLLSLYGTRREIEEMNLTGDNGLIAYSEKHSIDLEDQTKKADILEIILLWYDFKILELIDRT